MCFRSNKTLCTILKYEAQVFCRGVIYCIPCQDCDKLYIGKTGRTLKVRTSRDFVAMVKRTGLEYHNIHSKLTGTVIYREYNYNKRRNIKALFSKKFHNMNQDQGLAVSPIWSISFLIFCVASTPCNWILPLLFCC